jgi:PleD family two-component response regulator
LAPGNTLALSGLIIDEAHDIHTAQDAWQQISNQQGMLGRGWALLLADQQAHYRYTAFDKALTKPFLPDDMERALGVLIHRNNSELAAATPAIQPRSDGPYNPFGPDVSAKVRFDGKRCLVVDDNSINQMVISELMETFGFTIFTASDGKKALTAAVEHPCDIIMMDCRMPNMDGYDATRQLRAMMRAGHCPASPSSP